MKTDILFAIWRLRVHNYMDAHYYSSSWNRRGSNNNVHGCWFQATGQRRGVIRNVERRGRLGSEYSLLCRCGAHYFSWPKKKWRRSQMLPSLSCQHHRHLHRLRVGGQHENGRRICRRTTKLPFHWLEFFLLIIVILLLYTFGSLDVQRTPQLDAERIKLGNTVTHWCALDR